MKVNIELAKRLLKEQYFINGDNKIRTQHPIRVEDLAFIMQKYTDEQLTIHSVVVPKGTLKPLPEDMQEVLSKTVERVGKKETDLNNRL